MATLGIEKSSKFTALRQRVIKARAAQLKIIELQSSARVDDPSSSHAYGISMAFLTIASWGVIPILIKVVLSDVSAQPIALFRLGFASFMFWLIFRMRGAVRVTNLKKVAPYGVLGGAFFTAHYLLLFTCIDQGGPALAQMLVQTGALSLALSGIVIFGERLNGAQLLGAAITVCAIILFQYDISLGAVSFSAHTFATLIGVGSGLAWTGTASRAYDTVN